MCVSYPWHVVGLFAAANMVLYATSGELSHYRGCFFLGEISFLKRGVEVFRNVRCGWTFCCSFGVTGEILRLVRLYGYYY